MDKDVKKIWLRRILLGAIFIAIALLFVRYFFFSDKAVIDFLGKTLSEQTGLDVKIKSARSRLHRDLLLRDVTLSDSTGSLEIQIAEILLKYHPLALVKRELKIQSITIDRPQVTLNHRSKPSSITQRLTPDPGQIEIVSASLDSSRENGEIFTLPFMVNISELRISDGTFSYSQEGYNTAFNLLIPGINLKSENIQFSSSEDLHVTFDLNQNESIILEFVKAGQKLLIDSPMTLSALGQFKFSGSQIDLTLDLDPELHVTNRDNQQSSYPFPVSQIDIQARLLQMNHIFLDSIRCQFDDHSNILATGSFTDLKQGKAFHAKVIESQIQLEIWREMMEEVAPLFGWDKAIREFLITGEIRLIDVDLDGSLRDNPLVLTTSGACEFNNVAIDLYRRGIKVAGLNGEAHLSGVWPPGLDTPLTAVLTLSADTFRYADLDQKLGRLTDLKMTANAARQTSSDAVTASLALQAFSDLHNSVSVKLNLSGHEVDISQPLISQNWTVDSKISVDLLDIAALTDGRLSGKRSVEATVDFAEGILSTHLLAGSGLLTFSLEDRAFSLNPQGIKFRTKALLNHDEEMVDFQTINLSIPPYLNTTGAGFYADSSNWQIDLQHFTLNAENLLNALQPLLPAEMVNTSISGSLQGGGSFGINQNDGIPSFEYSADVTSNKLLIDHPMRKAKAVAKSLTASLSGGESGIEINGVIDVDSLIYLPLKPHPFRDHRYAWQYSSSKLTGQSHFELNALAHDLGLTGNLILKNNNSLTISAELMPAEFVEIREGLLFQGHAGVDLEISLTDSDALRTVGRLSCDSSDVSYMDILSAQNISLHLPFDTRLTQSNTADLISFFPEISAPARDPVQYIQTAHLHQGPLKSGQFHCHSLAVKGYQLNNLHTTMEIGTNSLLAPDITASAYDGTISGSLFLDFPQFQADSVQYELHLSANNINTARLPRINTKKSEASELSAFAYFQGEGLNPRTHFDINGNLHFTSIGRQVADNILRFINPGQSDPSIRTFRRYLNRGWGVRVFSFDIKDDFVYVSIPPAKPPLTQPDMWLLSRFIGLGESITFSRIPVRYFLDSPTLFAVEAQ
ncbi:hypothetical protein KJ564_00730 [bacterium]|nr:hypothetical protein [bacterium]